MVYSLGIRTTPTLHSLSPVNIRALANVHDYLEDTMEIGFWTGSL